MPKLPSAISPEKPTRRHQSFPDDEICGPEHSLPAGDDEIRSGDDALSSKTIVSRLATMLSLWETINFLGESMKSGGLFIVSQLETILSRP